MDLECTITVGGLMRIIISISVLLQKQRFNNSIGVTCAFNMEKAEFIGHLIVVDSFSEHDDERLQMLFNEIDNANYQPFTAAEITKLESIAGVMVGSKWWMVFDIMQTMRQQNNGEGLYWNYWLHAWKIFSISPFENCIVYTSQTGSVTGLTLPYETLTLAPGASIQITPTVAGTGMYNRKVEYTLTAGSETAVAELSDGTKITPDGVLFISTNATINSFTVTVTSVDDSEVSDTVTVTVS